MSTFGARLLSAIAARLERQMLRNLRADLNFCHESAILRPPIVIESPDKVSIHDQASLASFVHIWGNGGVTIGRRVMIGSHTAISSATHDSSAPGMYDTLIAEPVVIEEEVWIGAHAVIFPGVTIGRNSIVAAGSVVRENVAAGSIVAGVPARMVKSDRMAMPVRNLAD
jgi:maltose O-acetyltransferase